MNLPSMQLIKRKPIDLEVTNQPFTCRHYDDDGRLLGEHDSRWWTVTSPHGPLMDISECGLKWQQVMTKDLKPYIPDTITPLILAHPDWDPAPPPEFPPLPVCPHCGR